jgi:hypothetical protein
MSMNMIIILDITLLMMISLLPPWCWSHTFMILDIIIWSSLSWYSTWFWWWWYQNHHTRYDFTDDNLITGFDYNNVRSMKISLLSPYSMKQWWWRSYHFHILDITCWWWPHHCHCTWWDFIMIFSSLSLY